MIVDLPSVIAILAIVAVLFVWDASTVISEDDHDF